MLPFPIDYGSSLGSGAVILDDCNFHESVHLDSFDVDRTLTLVSVVETFYYILTFSIFVERRHYNYFSVSVKVNRSQYCLIGTNRW